MACENQVGVRNIIITFYDCDTDTSYGPFSHELAGDEQPQYRLCPYSNEMMTGGYVRRNLGNNQINLSVIRNRTVPLAMYQGCAAVDITVEHFNGMVVTGLNGTGVGEELSDAHEVMLELAYRQVDELLPAEAA